MLGKTLKICSLMSLMMTVFCGCDLFRMSTEELAQEVKQSIREEFNKKDGLKKVRIDSLIVIRKDGNDYDGILKVSANGKTVTADVDITCDGEYFKLESNGTDMYEIRILTVYTIL